MKRIPREIEELIWRLTEEGTPAALDQFRARYPDYSMVLDQRLDMVKRLKKSVPAPKPEARPRFRPQSKVVERDFRWSVPVVLLAFAAISVAAFTAITANSASKKTVQNPPKVTPKQIAQGFPPPAEPVVVKQPEPAVKQAPVAEPEIPAYLQPQILTIRGARLSAVLQAVAGQGKFGITIGPGMADPTISVDYQGVNSIQILEDLGRQYAFTPFDQGDGSVVIIPARDPNAQSPAEKVNENAEVKPTPSGTTEDGSVSIQPHKIPTKTGENR